jgi:hypothetical protein
MTGQEAARARCVWNMVTTTSILESANVASITDNGTGDVTIAWTNNFANDTYFISGCMAFATDITSVVYSTQPKSRSSVAAASMRVVTVYSSGISDYPYNASVFFGDLA